MTSLLVRRSQAISARLGGALRLGGSRTINVFCDYSWAVEPLEKKGLKLDFKSSPEDEACIKVLDTPSKRVESLVDEILALDVIEYAQFITRFEGKLGVKRVVSDLAFHHSQNPASIRNFVYSGGVSVAGGAQAAGAGPAGGAAAAPAAEEKKEKDAFDLKLKVVDAKVKIKVIKEIRTITGLGLKEAKDLVEKAPVLVKPGLKKEEAEAFKKLLVDAGAEVELA